MSQLNQAKRAQIVAALVEGNSMRATARMIGVAFNTLLPIEELVSLLDAEAKRAA